MSDSTARINGEAGPNNDSEITQSAEVADSDIAEESDGTNSIFSQILGHMGTTRGHEFGIRLLDIINGVRIATIDARAQERKMQLDAHRVELESQRDRESRMLELRKFVASRTWWLQLVGIVSVVAAIVVLSVIDRLTPASGTILGAIAGYLFGQRRDSGGGAG